MEVLGNVYACICFAVTESEVCEAAARQGAPGDPVAHVSHETGAGTGCGSCVDRLRQLASAAPTAIDQAVSVRAA